MSGARVHICRFDALGDMSSRQKNKPLLVLKRLTTARRFSEFEVDEPLGRSLMHLFEHGYIAKTGGEYPWTEVEVTSAGLSALQSETPA